ncbi:MULTISPECIES: oligosaccharide flippase family protein [Sphingobacterium]|uniref:oligosaccharide flippase family protein n=1 Tax=Sphingobacterium TaxID=28453 RepID=UPI00257D5D6D|nr:MULTISPECIES: oligosaccharide flippase family protein [Sphingobacterium]
MCSYHKLYFTATLINSIKNKIGGLLSSDLNKRLFNHSFWILVGNIVSKFSLLIATVVMTRFMVKEEYGQFGIIKSTILMFAVFAGLELGMTATKYISEFRSIDRGKVERIIGLSNFFAILLSLSIGLFIYCFAAQIANQIAAPNLAKEIRISSFILFFSSLNGVQAGILNGIERFKESSINNATAGVLSSLLLVITSIYGNLDSVVLAFGFNFVILYALNYISIKKYFYVDFSIQILKRENFKEIGVLWKFSLPAILAGLMIGPVIWLCNYFLVNQPGGYQEMAVFDIANQWRTTILFIPAALSQIVLPLLASSVNDKAAYRMYFYKNLKINIYVGLLFVIVLVLLTPVIVWFYGGNYINATYPMLIMFITTAFIAANNVIGQAIASQGRMWLGFFVNLMWALVLIFSTYILVVQNSFGATGLALAYLISYIFHSFVQFVFVRKFL